MTDRQEIRSYDYVNHPYARVRAALVSDPAEVFSAATRAAASRARNVASELRVKIAGIEVGTEIDVSVGTVQEARLEGGTGPVTRIPIEWEASARAALFPVMSAELSVYPLTATETQLDFQGRYDPPMGLVGEAMDTVVGHRIADASVHRFVSDVAAYLRKVLSES